MRIFGKILILMLTMLMACNDPSDINDTTNPEFPPGFGILDFHFVMPEYNIPERDVHRISLNLSYDVEDLYREVYFHKENVSDYKEVYEILLPVGSYYFDAVITCSCAGDTCLNGGFPGGQFGMKHAFDKFTVLDHEKTTIKTVFQ
jgi:hypothetical protein